MARTNGVTYNIFTDDLKSNLPDLYSILQSRGLSWLEIEGLV